MATEFPEDKEGTKIVILSQNGVFRLFNGFYGSIAHDPELDTKTATYILLNLTMVVLLSELGVLHQNLHQYKDLFGSETWQFSTESLTTTSELKRFGYTKVISPQPLPHTILCLARLPSISVYLLFSLFGAGLS